MVMRLRYVLLKYVQLILGYGEAQKDTSGLNVGSKNS